MKRVDIRRVVVLDESSANTRMGRSHAWIRRGEELVDHRPTNWGKPLTMIGAVRVQGWINLGTQWGAATARSFVSWFSRYLLPKLKPGDIVVLDNAAIHKSFELRKVACQKDVRVKFLPPYSPDLSPIEPAWALIKQQIKAAAPRTQIALHRIVHRARRRVTPDHCKGWFRHCGFRGILK